MPRVLTLPTTIDAPTSRPRVASISAIGLRIDAALIREKRIKAGLSQAQVADRVGCTRGYVGHIEGGRRQPSWLLVERFAVLFSVPTGRLAVKVR